MTKITIKQARQIAMGVAEQAEKRRREEIENLEGMIHTCQECECDELRRKLEIATKTIERLRMLAVTREHAEIADSALKQIREEK